MAPRVRIAAPQNSRLRDLRRISPDIRAATGEALREAAREAIKELQDIGPAYSGRFRNSWQTEIEGRGRKVSIKTGIARFKEQDFKGGRQPAILIGNSASYAQEAMDLIPGKFIAQKEGPEKTPVKTGQRVGDYRGDVKDLSFDEMADKELKRLAISTAEQDWFQNFMSSGPFGQTFRRGAARGFGQYVRGRSE